MTSMLDISRIRAIGLDLDDTLWPVEPVILGADKAMLDWLAERAPGASALFADMAQRSEIRRHVVSRFPDQAHDMSAVRLACLREALLRCAEDDAHAQGAFDVFFEHRMRVALYEDVLESLVALARRYPLVAISNGNADVQRVGLGAHFRAAMNVRISGGFAKPDARIFHAAAKALDLPTDSVLHVGDDPHLDVVGACEAGMQAVWVNRTGQTWSHASHQPHATVTELRALCGLLGVGIQPRVMAVRAERTAPSSVAGYGPSM